MFGVNSVKLSQDDGGLLLPPALATLLLGGLPLAAGAALGSVLGSLRHREAE